MARAALLLVALVTAGASANDLLGQPPRCPHQMLERCSSGGYGQNEYTYFVDGLIVKIEYADSGYFALNCPDGLSLDNPALPRFESQLRVNKVQLTNCTLPQDSYAAVLRTLNVAVLDKLKLNRAGSLAPQHFSDLRRLLALELVDAALQPGALQPLVAMRRLLLDRVRLPPDELLRLPRSLETLQLVRMGTPLPAAALDRLPALVNVTVRDAASVDVQPSGAVQALALDMPAVRLPDALPASLRRLTVFGWDAPRPEPWAACEALDTLVARFATATVLPGDWLRRCGRVRVLHVLAARGLAELAPDALRGARLLQELRVADCALETLPAGLLDDAEQLSLLDLSGNRLRDLPSGLFARTKSLQSLNLSKNLLTTKVFSLFLAATSLTTLQLNSNVDLKDSCGDASDPVRRVSPLQYLSKLTKLYLRNTSATLICRDWRENMPQLDTLDLANNNIAVLTYADVQFHGSVDVFVNLSGNNVTKLYFSRDDYEFATSHEPSRAIVKLDDTLHCDCNAYWAARLLRERPERLRAPGAACAAPRRAELRGVPEDGLVCAAPLLCAGVPRCSCHVQDAPAGGRLVLRVRCERANVSRVSHVVSRVSDAIRAASPAFRSESLSPSHFVWQLHLAHNEIDALHAADLPEHLSVLDLQYNKLSTVDADVANALLSDSSRRVLLAYNPLDCSCGAAEAGLEALRAARGALADRAELACAGGVPLARLPPERCAGVPPAAFAAAAALALLLAAAALLGSLAHPAVRLRIKAALHRRGWLPAAEPEDERRFDAFVSFSHGDERFVREQLVARLESGPAPYRVCVHYRDWAPGGWIPAQIAASVRAARRTVCVVSVHFLRSAWARAELREAYALALRDAAPRLVLVLLDDPERLPLDDRLRRYIEANTYVRWGDPWFWQKLYLALPRGRPADVTSAGDSDGERHATDDKAYDAQYANNVKPYDAQYANDVKPYDAQYASNVKPYDTQYASDVKPYDSHYASDVKPYDVQYANDVKTCGDHYATDVKSCTMPLRAQV